MLFRSRSGLLTIEQMNEVALWRIQKNQVTQLYPELGGRRLVHEVVRRIIHVLVDDLVRETQRRLNQYQPTSVDDVRNMPALLGFSEEIRSQATEMKRFLFKNLYRHPRVTEVTQEAADMVRALFNHYHLNSQMLPEGFRVEDPLERRIAHYIAGMTDRYAAKEFKKIGS